MKVWAWMAVSALALLGCWLLIRRVQAWGWRWAFRAAAGPAVSVVLLVRDAADILEGVLRFLLDPEAAGWQPRCRYEVVVAELGSRDESPAILQRLARRHPGLRVCFLPGPAGPGLPAPEEGSGSPGWGGPEAAVALLSCCRYPVALVCPLFGNQARPVLAALASLLGSSTAEPSAAGPLPWEGRPDSLAG